MAGLGLVGLTDVARSFGPNIYEATPESIAQWLKREWLGRKGGGFNYNPVLFAALQVLKKEWTREQALKHIRSVGPEFGRASNEAVYEAIEAYLTAHSGPAYALRYVAVMIAKHDGRGIHIGVKAPAVRVQDGVATIFYPAFRKTFRPSEQQAILELSIVLEVLAENDFYGARIEHVAAQPTGRGLERVGVIRTPSELELLPKATVDGLLAKYADAVRLVWSEGVGLQKPRLGGYHVIDPDQPDLF